MTPLDFYRQSIRYLDQLLVTSPATYWDNLRFVFCNPEQTKIKALARVHYLDHVEDPVIIPGTVEGGSLQKECMEYLYEMKLKIQAFQAKEDHKNV